MSQALCCKASRGTASPWGAVQSLQGHRSAEGLCWAHSPKAHSTPTSQILGPQQAETMRTGTATGQTLPSTPYLQGRQYLLSETGARSPDPKADEVSLT